MTLHVKNTVGHPVDLDGGKQLAAEEFAYVDPEAPLAKAALEAGHLTPVSRAAGADEQPAKKTAARKEA